jgi:hypothetical protein
MHGSANVLCFGLLYIESGNAAQRERPSLFQQSTTTSLPSWVQSLTNHHQGLCINKIQHQVNESCIIVKLKRNI